MAAENKLSDRMLKSLLGKPLDKQVTISDGRGMSIRVSSKGAISFVYFFRLGGRNTSPIWMTLGRYPDMTLKAAREKRDQCRTWLSEGKDPRIHSKIRERSTLLPVSIKDAIVYWFDNYANEHRKEHKDLYRRFEKYVFPHIGYIPVSECRLEHWIECFERVKKISPVVACRILRDSQQAFKFCRIRKYAMYHELDDLTANDVGKESKPRARMHTSEQLKDIWKNIFHGGDVECNGSYRSRVIVLCVVFGCRMSEARLSGWDEWDMDNWIWTVPSNHSKTGEEIIRPIPELLRHWVINLNDETKGKEFILGKESRANSVSSAAKKLCVLFRHNTWSIHDFRRTFATSLNDMGIDFYVVESLLGHKLPGVSGVYNRSQFLHKKLAALNMWMCYLEGLISEATNVRFIKRA
jgi:integrase